jgi:ABC-type microcin C transport system duplicated ATPase subunit YejF
MIFQIRCQHSTRAPDRDQIVEMINLTRTSPGDAAKRAVELLDVVGIPQPDQRARQYPHEFLAAEPASDDAMAIANDPEVLIADELTTALMSPCRPRSSTCSTARLTRRS